MKYQSTPKSLLRETGSFCLAFLSCLLLAAVAHAMPAESSWRTFQQPKGSSLSGFQFTGRAQGDEWLDWYETKDGKIFLQNPKTGGYEYAVLKDGGSGKKSVTQLGLSGILVGTPSVKPPEVSFDDVVRMWEDLRLLEGVEFPLNEQEPRPPKWRFPTLIILVNFTDFQGLGPSHYRRKVFGSEPFTVNHYYAEVSRGLVQFDPAPEGQGTANDGVVTVQLDYDNPAPNQVWGGDQRLRDELRKSTLIDALTLVDQNVDFAHFDSNSDGGLSHNELQLIFVWANPRGQYKVWPHASSFQNMEEAHWDGVRVGDYDDQGRYVVMLKSGHIW